MVENSGLNVGALNCEVIVNLLSGIFILNKAGFTVNVETDERSILKGKAVGLDVFFLTRLNIGDCEVSILFALDLEVVIFLILLKRNVDN